LQGYPFDKNNRAQDHRVKLTGGCKIKGQVGQVQQPYTNTHHHQQTEKQHFQPARMLE